MHRASHSGNLMSAIFKHPKLPSIMRLETSNFRRKLEELRRLIFDVRLLPGRKRSDFYLFKRIVIRTRGRQIRIQIGQK